MVKAIVTDVEGTTSSIAFVKEVLFPFARARLPAFVAARQHDPEVRPLLAAVGEALGGETELGALIGQLVLWSDEDKKIIALKALQGLIWEDGYGRGELQGHVYADAAHYLRRWRQGGLGLYVYSSGSVKAQRLLFAHTGHGDLTALFSGHFDTRIGGKKETGSYQAIAASVNLPAGALLFLSDTDEELDAAKAAGFATCRLNRDAAVCAADHPQARDFSDVDALLAGRFGFTA